MPLQTILLAHKKKKRQATRITNYLQPHVVDQTTNIFLKEGKMMKGT